MTDVVDIELAGIEDDYIKNLGLTLLNGRQFSKGYAADSTGIILNQTAIRQLGFTVENAVGKKVNYDFGGRHAYLHIVGVIKNFNFESVHKTIQPFGFTTGLFVGKYTYTIATVNTQNYSQLLKGISKVWTSLNPGTPFVYSFLDQDFQRSYLKEWLISRIVSAHLSSILRPSSRVILSGWSSLLHSSPHHLHGS